jgi:SAM-dependent methyltransferase
MGQYVFQRGGDGAERLRLLARLTWPTTAALLRRAGLAAGMRCLDVGCGIGRVTLELARWVGPSGRAVGIDLDAPFLDLARAEAERHGLGAEFRQGDVESLDEAAGYDLVYARFLLSHLRDPAGAVVRLARVVRPGGVLAVEDVDFRGRFCHPASAAFARLVALYTAAVQHLGADPNIGPRLPDLLQDAGVDPIHLDVATPTFRDGEGKFLPRFDLEGIRAAVVAAGLATVAEVDDLAAELEAFARRPRTILSLPRIFQVWGKVP